MATCNASLRIQDDGDGVMSNNPFAGNPAVYTTPDYVEIPHLLSIRLGRTTDVSVMVNGTEAQQREYVQGILIAAVACFAFFTLWMMILLILKCCGHERVGFFSGQRIRRPMPPTPPLEELQGCFADDGGLMVREDETDEEKAKRILAAFEGQGGGYHLAVKATDTTQDTPVEEANEQQVPQAAATLNSNPSPAVMEYCKKVKKWQGKVKQAERVQRRVRIVVILCCLGVICSAILMVIKGVGALATSVHDVRVGLDQTAGLATTAMGLVDQFVLAQNEAVNVTESMLLNFNTGLCPALREQFCTNILMVDENDCNFTGLPFEEEIQQVVESFDGILTPHIQAVEEAIGEVEETIGYEEEIQQVVESFNGNLTPHIQPVEEAIGEVEETIGNVQQEIENTKNFVKKEIERIKNVVYKELIGARKYLQQVVDKSEEIDQQVASFDWAFDVASAFAMALAILSVFILIGVVLAWRAELEGSCFRWVRNWLVVPIFVLLVFLSLVFSCIFVIGSITTSDVCYNSPDPLVLQVMEKSLFKELEKSSKDFGPILSKFLAFYVEGCPADVVPLDVNGDVNTILRTLDAIATPLQDILTSQAFVDLCGDNSVLLSGTEAVVKVICFVSMLILDVRDLLNCDNWNSVYSTFAYDAVCYDATKGFVWISSTQLAIVFFSMLIVTLRVACYEIEDEEDFLNQRRLCARLCCCFASSSKDKDEHGNGDNDNENGDGLVKPLDSEPDNEPAPEAPREESVEATTKARYYSF